MSIFSRFFGRKEEPADTGALAANPALEDPVAMSVVFANALALDADRVAQALRAFDPSMKNARCERAPDIGEVFGLVGWGRHVVQLVGFNAPMPKDSVERCVAPSHYGAEMKDQVRAHRSHLILYYAGHDTDTLEQYVALAAVAGALQGLGALAVLNETAHTSLPIGVLAAEDEDPSDRIELLRALPLLMLYCGFVKYEVDGIAGVWMRSYGAAAFGQPDFAALAAGHHEGQRYVDIFGNVLSYLAESGAEMAPGHMMQVGETTHMGLRAPTESEYFLDGPGTVLVAELIEADQINRA